MGDMVKLTGLWTGKTAAGDPKMTGRMGSARVLILKNKFKKQDNHPDYELFLVPIEKDGNGQGEAAAEPTAPIREDELPF